MTQAYEIKYYNRYSQKMEIEKVYGHKAIELAYGPIIGTAIAPILASKTLSKIYGSMQNSEKSAKKVPEFIKNFEIKIDDFKGGSFSHHQVEESYKSFNEFFIREFKDGVRSFSSNADTLSAPAEARYFGYETISDQLKIPVKGKMLKASSLVNNEKYGKLFDGGPLVIARLCPVDYHRYHYPDHGKTIEAYGVKGNLHSVNPIALKRREDIFIKNERRVSILETENFGKIAYIEVGATCVGKIVQTFNEKKSFKKGDEKGYFLFGGSTVILCGEKGKWTPCSDILKNTEQGVETYIHLGDSLGELI